MKRFDIHRWTTERISQTILYVLTVIIVITFALFYLIGYNIPYLFNPSLNAPLLTDGVMGVMDLLLLSGVGIIVWSGIYTAGRRGKHAGNDNNIPARKIGYAVAGGTSLLLVLTLALGSGETLLINGQPFSDVLWLKLSDMFLLTSFFLLVIAVAAMAYGKSRSYRQPKK